MECLPFSDTQIWIIWKTPEKVIQNVLLNSIYLWVMLEWLTAGQKLSQSAPTLGTQKMNYHVMHRRDIFAFFKLMKLY